MTRQLLAKLAFLFGLIAGENVLSQEPPNVVLSEILAVNDRGLVDEDREHTDWIEVENRDQVTVRLYGWYLSDDPQVAKWAFPDVKIGPGEFVVVFASGKNRAVAGEEPHTNFRLDQGGEYLALLAPDFEVVDELRYPRQRRDISYGLAQADNASFDLVRSGAAARFSVPEDASFGFSWTLADFDDAAWDDGTTAIGYGAVGVPGELVNVALNGTATLSSVNGGRGGQMAIDDDFGTITHTLSGVNLPSTWSVALEESVEIERIVLHNRPNLVGSRLRDLIVTVRDVAGVTRFRSALVNPENVLGGGGLDGPPSIELDLVELEGKPVIGRSVEVVRVPDPDLSGTGGEGNDDEADVLSLSEVQVFARTRGRLVDTDVEEQMLDANSSLYVRIPFEVADPGAIETLNLSVTYDDGFAAYINGTEVARRHAPEELAWNSRATAERPADDATRFVVFDVSEHRDLLQPGRNVLALHGLNIAPGDADFLILPELVGSSTDGFGRFYLTSPSPGGPNAGQAFTGFVEDTQFRVDRGFYKEPFEVAISTKTEDAEIVYTIDGSEPKRRSGQPYTEPIKIETTTTLRAAAFKDGFLSTNVDTQTYIFIADVLQQRRPDGYPTRWAGRMADYEMDPEIVDSARYRDFMEEALLDVPTLSIVTPRPNLFGPGGIYDHPQSEGIAWERPCSVELFYPDGSEEGFQVNAGLRIRGAASRNPDMLKHSFRLLFKSKYGATKLEYPLFGPDAADRFDTLALRGEYNNSWQHATGDQRNRALYLRDQWARNAQLAMGQLSSHGFFLHLYLNGLYWGRYNILERPNASFQASYLGGDKEDYDSLNSGRVVDGDSRAYSRMLSFAGRSLASEATYSDVQQWVDVPNLIDYMIMNVYGENGDWVSHNWYVGRKREPGAGFKFFSWDAERVLETVSENQVEVSASNNPAITLYHRLRSNPEFRLLFADHVHRHFFNEGALTPNSALGLFTELAEAMDLAIICESARWGDQRRDVLRFSPPFELYERNVQWIRERDRLISTYFPNRTRNVLQQFTAARLYPDIEAPVFSQHGGRFEAELHLAMRSDDGAVLYTLDGMDPRLPGGATSPSALEVGGGVTLARTTRVRARTLARGEWSAMNEALFVADSSGLRITELMYHPASPLVGPFKSNDFEFIEFQSVGQRPLNLAGIRFSSGVEFTFPEFEEGPAADLAPGEVVLVVGNLEAFETRYETDGLLIAGEYTGHLDNAGESLRLVDAGGEPILDFSYSDRWQPSTDGEGFSLEIADALAEPATWGEAGSWLRSEDVGGSPGVHDALVRPGEGWQLPGDANQNGRLDLSDGVRVLGILFLEQDGDPLPCADGELTDEGNRSLLDSNGDAVINITDGIHILNFLFLGGERPALGTECVRLSGCPEVCGVR